MLLKQEDVQRMAYQNYDGVKYFYGDEEKLHKKFNRKIVRNYILFTLLGSAVTATTFLAAKNPAIIKIILGAYIIVVLGASISAPIISFIKDLKEANQKSVL